MPCTTQDFFDLFATSNLDLEPDIIRVGCGLMFMFVNHLNNPRSLDMTVFVTFKEKSASISSSTSVKIVVLFEVEVTIAGDKLSVGASDVYLSDRTSR